MPFSMPVFWIVFSFLQCGLALLRFFTQEPGQGLGWLHLLIAGAFAGIFIVWVKIYRDQRARRRLDYDDDEGDNEELESALILYEMRQRQAQEATERARAAQAQAELHTPHPATVNNTDAAPTISLQKRRTYEEEITHSRKLDLD